MNRCSGRLKSGLFVLALVLAGAVQSGNPDRAGQAGGGELLINPWARSSGMAGANSASVRGLESSQLNIAGISFTEKTEALFAHTIWFNGTDINLNAFGFTQKVGQAGVLGFSVMAMDFGRIDVTTVELPDGGVGVFHPQYLNMGLSFARTFMNSIHGGINVKILQEGVSDASASGVAFDAGIQYVTGKREQLKFGIALRNVGPSMKFSGDGLSLLIIPPSRDFNMTMEQRAENLELPSLLNIGGTYDFHIKEMHRLSVSGNFTSNSFNKDQYQFGLEYGFRSYVMLRVGYIYEDGIFEETSRSTAFTSSPLGPCAGLTVELPMGKTDKEKGNAHTFGLDYSYRATEPFGGNHSMGVRINL